MFSYDLYGNIPNKPCFTLKPYAILTSSISNFFKSVRVSVVFYDLLTLVEDRFELEITFLNYSYRYFYSLNLSKYNRVFNGNCVKSFYKFVINH